MKIKKWIVISEFGKDNWILSIWSAIHKAEKKQKLFKMGKDVGELAMSIQMKFEIITRVLQRIKEKREQILKEVNDKFELKYVYTEHTIPKSRYAMLIDDEIKYKFLIDIESLFFELIACRDLIGKFLCRMYCNSGKFLEERDINTHLKNVIGKGKRWQKLFSDLVESRNFFVHKGTCYIAVDVSKKPYDLILTKKFNQKFQNEKDYITIEHLIDMVKNFYEVRIDLKNYMIKYLENL